MVRVAERLLEAGSDHAAPATRRRLAHQTHIEADHRATFLTDDLGAHLIRDTGGDEEFDVDVPSGLRAQDGDLRVLKSFRRSRIRGGPDDLDRGDLLAEHKSGDVDLV